VEVFLHNAKLSLLNSWPWVGWGPIVETIFACFYMDKIFITSIEQKKTNSNLIRSFWIYEDSRL
jgi:hypothetical protein